MVTIRRAKLKDVDGIVSIWRNFMQEHREMGSNWEEDRIPEFVDNVDELVGSHFSKSIRSKNAHVLVIDDQGEVKGFMLSMIMKNIPIFKAERIGILSSLHIEKEHRGKGYSSKMFKLTKDWFKSKGATEITIRVMCCNDNAYRIYRKWGFKDIHVEMRLEE